MKIKLALVEDDTNYIDHIRLALNSKYDNEVELFSFDSIDKLNSLYKELNPNVILLNENMDYNDLVKSTNYAVGYLSPSNDMTSIKGLKAVSKYQKIDLFYNDVLTLYSEVAENSMEFSSDNGNKPIVLFTSPAGGAGTSVLAAAYVHRLAGQGKKPLYINLEVFSDVAQYFEAEGSQNFSDVVYALKSKKTNLMIKLKSSIKTSADGVSFISSCNLPLDLMETDAADYELLLNTLKSLNEYDVIVIDSDFSFSEKNMVLFNKATDIITVSDGSVTANIKVRKMTHAFEIYDKQKGSAISKKVRLFYNKFSNKTSRQIENLDYIGGIQRYEGFPEDDLIKRISEIQTLDKI